MDHASGYTPESKITLKFDKKSGLLFRLNYLNKGYQVLNASIFTADVTAIDLALGIIAESDDDHFIIFSDSNSVLLSLHNRKMDNPLILRL